MANSPNPPNKPPGDPAGKRLSRHKALLLAEAVRTARSLEVLMKRANYDFSGCTKLIKEMAEREKIDDYRVAANEVKQEFFKRTDITFHEPNMRLTRTFGAKES